MARVFSQKHSSIYVGNVGIYSVGKDRVYQKWQSGKTECFTGILREGLTHETLAKTRCLHPVLTLRIPIMCRAHASLLGKLPRELPTKTASVFNLPWVFTLSLSHTTFTNESNMKYRVQKIEQNYNQIWHEIKANKSIVVNYNFTSITSITCKTWCTYWFQKPHYLRILKVVFSSLNFSWSKLYRMIIGSGGLLPLKASVFLVKDFCLMKITFVC